MAPSILLGIFILVSGKLVAGAPTFIPTSPPTDYKFETSFNFALAGACLSASFVAFFYLLVFGGIHKIAFYRIRRVTMRCSHIFTESYKILHHKLLENYYKKILEKRELTIEEQNMRGVHIEDYEKCIASNSLNIQEKSKKNDRLGIVNDNRKEDDDDR